MFGLPAGSFATDAAAKGWVGGVSMLSGDGVTEITLYEPEHGKRSAVRCMESPIPKVAGIPCNAQRERLTAADKLNAEPDRRALSSHSDQTNDCGA